MGLFLTDDAAANSYLESDAFALLIGMVLDQQVPMERAFAAPRELRSRLGNNLDVEKIAASSTDDLVKVFSDKPALHRFPGAMAERVQALAQVLVSQYDSNAAGVWEGVENGDDLFRRIKSLPGFGEQKAKIFMALLAKRLGVRPKGWEKVTAPYGEKGSYFSIADIDGPEGMRRVRDHKKQMKLAAKEAASVSTKAKTPSKLSR